MVCLQDTNMGGTQPEETGATASETNDEAVEGDAQTTRAELAASLQVRSLFYEVFWISPVYINAFLLVIVLGVI